MRPHLYLLSILLVIGSPLSAQPHTRPLPDLPAPPPPHPPPPLHLLSLLLLIGSPLPAHPHTRPVPDLQALPLPHHQISFDRLGHEIARYHFSPNDRRPFLYPLIGPSGRSLSRMGHPHDPESHSHHNSVWISHHDVNGVGFWNDSSKGKILHKRIESFTDDAKTRTASIITLNHWLDEGTNRVLLHERRRTQI